MLYAALYFTMFLVILLDRRDPLTGQTTSEGVNDLVEATQGMLTGG